jgi:hypothetical protein
MGRIVFACDVCFALPRSPPSPLCSSHRAVRFSLQVTLLSTPRAASLAIVSLAAA